MPKFDDLTGKRFGRYTVLSRGPSHNGHSHWVCRCDCGAMKTVRAQNLKESGTVSCGCSHKEALRERCISQATHGYARKAKRAPAYIVWMNMIQRCTNPNNGAYHNYGARGIGVSDRWRSFLLFLEDMGEPPRGKTIDRIDVNLGYEPGNCRWATQKEQMNNVRYNRIIEFRGKRLTMQQWADKTGISVATLRSRIVTNNWPIEEALTQPVSAVRLKNR